MISKNYNSTKTIINESLHRGHWCWLLLEYCVSCADALGDFFHQNKHSNSGYILKMFHDNGYLINNSTLQIIIIRICHCCKGDDSVKAVQYVGGRAECHHQFLSAQRPQ